MFKKILIASVLIGGSFVAMAQDKKIAILDPIGDVTSHIREIVREEISSSIISIGGYTVLERSLIDKVLEENKFQMSGMVNDSQVSEIGKLLGANYVFVTSLNPISGNYHISFKLIEVSSARIERQETVRTTRGGTNDLIVVVQREINNMFRKEAKLTLEGRKIFANNIKLDDKQIKNLMVNTDALKYYNKSKSQRKTGTALVWTGVLAFVAGISFDLINNYDFDNGDFMKCLYVREGEIIYEKRVFKIQGIVIGGATGAALIGTGIVLRSSSTKSLQKSVDTYNSNKKTAQSEIRLGVMENGIGLAINF